MDSKTVFLHGVHEAPVVVAMRAVTIAAYDLYRANVIDHEALSAIQGAGIFVMRLVEGDAPECGGAPLAGQALRDEIAKQRDYAARSSYGQTAFFVAYVAALNTALGFI